LNKTHIFAECTYYEHFYTRKIMKKNRFIVVNENTLAIQRTEVSIVVLSASIIKGSRFNTEGGPMLLNKSDNIRLANRKDFSGLRISDDSYKGYVNSGDYEFQHEVLTKENAHEVRSISKISNPEWGIKKFNYNDQPLTGGSVASSFGTGSNSAVLFDNEYHLWQIESYK